MRKQLLLCVLLLLVSMGVYGQLKPAAQLHYNKDGKFKIVQITDTHVIPGNPRSEITLKNLEAVLDAEKPDFVIHTGDIVYGKPAAEAAPGCLNSLRASLASTAGYASQTARRYRNSTCIPALKG